MTAILIILAVMMYLLIGFLLVKYATSNEGAWNIFYVNYGSESIILILFWPIFAIIEYGGKLMDKLLGI